jgi:hypothetical protein
MIPPTVIKIPKRLLSVTDLPLNAHPMLTIETVFRCPTTVLLTGPELFTMKNWEILIREANPPLINIINHRYIGTSPMTGMRSTNGMANRSMTLEMGAWFRRSWEDDIWSFLW